MKTIQSILYSTMKSPYGVILLAKSAQGLCALWLGESEQELVDQLPGAFPGAAFSLGKIDFSLEQLHSEKPYSVALDLKGTPFQLKVWNALLKTHWGETLTYEELAQRIGNPKAVRAVASACGKNQISLIIPCHRILRKDGKPSGYRWGIARKEKILKREKGAMRYHRSPN